MSYLVEVACSVAIWAALGYLFTAAIGDAKMFLVCPAAIIGIGAYSFSVALVAADGGNQFHVVVAILVGVVALSAIVLCLCGLWGDDLIVGSFALQMLIVQILKAWRDVTGGDEGFSLHSRWLAAISPWIPALAVLGGCAAAWLLGRRSALRLIANYVGHRPVLAVSYGVDVVAVRAMLIAFSALGGAICGALLAAMKGYVSPGDFDLFTSIQILAVVLIARELSPLVGPLVGAMMVIAIPEIIRASELFSTAEAGHVERIIFGGVLIVWAVLRLPKQEASALTLSGGRRHEPSS